MFRLRKDYLYFRFKSVIENKINMLCWRIADRGGVAFKVEYENRVMYINGLRYTWDVNYFYDDKNNIIAPIIDSSVGDLYESLVK